MILFFKNLIKKILLRKNICFYKNISNKELLEVIKLFKPYNVGHKLIRIGGDSDGGYLVPDILNDVKYCFSAGVGDQSSFEISLLDRNIKSFLADHSVEFDVKNKNLVFDKKFIKSYVSKNSWNINGWIKDKIPDPNEKNFILQMDIEGSEYEVISAITDENLKKMKILIIEFHSLEYSGNPLVYNVIRSSIEKLSKFFDVCHIHPNNWKKKTKVNSYEFPSNLEVTLLNKKYVEQKKPINFLPNNLDRKNVKNKPDVKLDNYWYR